MEVMGPFLGGLGPVELTGKTSPGESTVPPTLEQVRHCQETS